MSRAVTRAVLPWTLHVSLLVTLAAVPVAAHGSAPEQHGHTIPVLVFLGGVLVLGVSLAADHWGVLDRSAADVGVVGGGLGIVLSVGLLWL